jgi:hypothetical protein
MLWKVQSYNVNHKSYSLFWCYFKLKVLLTATLVLVNEAMRGHVKQQREWGRGDRVSEAGV